MTSNSWRVRASVLRTVLPIVGAFSSTLTEAAPPGFDVDLPAQSLSSSVRTLSLQTGQSIIVDARLSAKATGNAVHGHLDVERALSALLSGTGLVPVRVAGGYVINRGGTDKADADIVVTGTRIRGAAPVGSELVTIDRADIERSGYATTQQILATLPQNFGGGAGETTAAFTERNNAGLNDSEGAGINLRGLGNTSTLTLIDGNRLPLGGVGGQFVDLSLIPTSLIDRIEVLPDGASAIYGSDAVAGVVNVRLRKQIKGAETQVHVGFADGFKEVQLSQVAGLNWSSGHLILAYEYYHRGRLSADRRDYATENLTRFGGPDYRQDYGNPATIIAADGSLYGIPRGQDGTALTAADLVPGAANLADARAHTDLLPRVRRHTAYLGVEQSLTSWLNFSAQGFFADRRSAQRFYPLNSGVIVDPGDRYYVDPLGTNAPITVDYNFEPDLGVPTTLGSAREWSAKAGLRATLGQWNAEVSAIYASDLETQLYTNEPNYYRLALALADPDPATAYNLLGDGSSTNPATIDWVRGSGRSTNTARQWTTGVKFDGPLFHLPAGEVRVAVGGEYRRENYGGTSVGDQYGATPTDYGDLGLTKRRSIAAAYAELLVPVVGDDQQVPGIRKLDLSLAGRIEHYSDFGLTGNPRFGLSWMPLAGLTVRASYGTSFRAPTVNDTRQGIGLNQIATVPIPDPSSLTGTSNVLGIFGNKSGLGPERARIWTVGFDARPRVVEGVSLSATYFHIDYRDRIANPALDFFSFLINRSQYAPLIQDNPDPARVAALYASPYFTNLYGIAATDVQFIADAENANLSKQIVRGFDFDLAYRRGSDDRSYEIGIAGTYLLAVKQQLTSASPLVDNVSTIGYPVDLRLRARAIGTTGRLSAAAYLNFTDGYRNTAVLPVERVRSWTTVDLQLGYTLMQDRNLRATISVTNLLDADPPYVNNRTSVTASGFDPEQASPIGRMVSLTLAKTW